MTVASLSLVRTVDQPTIDRYAQTSGDFNPIHVDPVYAAKSPFGRTIAHGLMTLAYVADMLNRWSDGRFDEAGEIEVTFVGPVFVGDTVEISGVAEEHVERDGQECLRIKLRVTAGERLILTGYAIHPDTKTGS